MACSSWMNGLSAAAMSWEAGDNRSRRVFYEDHHHTPSIPRRWQRERYSWGYVWKSRHEAADLLYQALGGIAAHVGQHD
jgi:hypothetical protein